MIPKNKYNCQDACLGAKSYIFVQTYKFNIKKTKNNHSLRQSQQIIAKTPSFSKENFFIQHLVLPLRVL